MNKHLSSVILTVGALLCCASSAAAAPDDPSPARHGDQPSSACTPANLARLRKTLALTSASQQAQAAHLIETLLCKPNTAANRAILRPLVPPKVRMLVQDTGSEDRVIRVARDDELLGSMLAGGAAWDVNLLGSDDELVVQYQANEACVKSRTLALVKRTWRVARIAEACD